MRILKETYYEPQKKSFPWIGILLILASVVCFVLFGYWLLRSRKEDTVLKEAYVMIQDEDDTLDDDKIDNESTYKNAKPVEFVEVNGVRVQKKFEDLYRANNEFVGWIKIKGTNIDYPVCQKPGDNEYYLSHNYEQNYAASGCIYMDGQATLDESDNMLLHGHHMRSGTMFQNLMKYEKEDFYREHKKFRFDTINGNGRYEVVAVFRSKIYDEDDTTSFKYYEFFNAADEEAFNEYVAEIKARSIYDTGVDVEYGETLLTLSTCAYHTKEGRMVVVAKKIWSN